MERHQRALRHKIITSIIFTLGVVIMLSAFPLVGAFAQGTQGSADLSAGQVEVTKWAFIAAAIAFGFGALGAGIGIGNVGAAAMGAISEKPEVAGQALIFIALAEGLVVFGFITALIILGRV